jgi:TPR repeat protein
MYLRGEGVKADVAKGLELLRVAAAEGSYNAAFNLGALHRSGANSVPVDLAESRRYFLLARKLGCPLSVDDYLN